MEEVELARKEKRLAEAKAFVRAAVSHFSTGTQKGSMLCMAALGYAYLRFYPKKKELGFWFVKASNLFNGELEELKKIHQID